MPLDWASFDNFCTGGQQALTASSDEQQEEGAEEIEVGLAGFSCTNLAKLAYNTCDIVRVPTLPQHFQSYYPSERDAARGVRSDSYGQKKDASKSKHAAIAMAAMIPSQVQVKKSQSTRTFDADTSKNTTRMSSQVDKWENLFDDTFTATDSEVSSQVKRTTSDGVDLKKDEERRILPCWSSRQCVIVACLMAALGIVALAVTIALGVNESSDQSATAGGESATVTDPYDNESSFDKEDTFYPHSTGACGRKDIETLDCGATFKPGLPRSCCDGMVCQLDGPLCIPAAVIEEENANQVPLKEQPVVNGFEKQPTNRPTRKPTLIPILLPQKIMLKTNPELVNDLVGFASISGYGRTGTTGGEGGKIVWVINRDDFLQAIGQNEPYTILVHGMIDLRDPNCPCKTMYTVKSDKTILGISSNSGFVNGGLEVQGVKFETPPRPPGWKPGDACICKENEEEERRWLQKGERRYPQDIARLPPDATPTNNVIIRNLNLVNCPNDCINIEKFAHHIWIDHNQFSNPKDGAVDVKRGADLITVSWNHFSDASKTMLCGHDNYNGSQDIGRLRTTYHHNYFRETEQRHPRVRFAEPVHIYNNYYLDNRIYGVASVMNAGLVIEANYFDNVDEPIRKRQQEESDSGETPGRIVERENVYMRSGSPPRSDDGVVEPRMYYQYRMHWAYDVPRIVREYAGTGVVY